MDSPNQDGEHRRRQPRLGRPGPGPRRPGRPASPTGNTATSTPNAGADGQQVHQGRGERDQQTAEHHGQHRNDSPTIPLTSALMNLLSIGAAFGVLVRGVPVGLAGRPGRRDPGRADRGVAAGVGVRRPVRTVHGLPRCSCSAACTRSGGGPATTGGPSPSAWANNRAHHHRGGADHDRGVRRVRARRPAGDQGDSASACRPACWWTPYSCGPRWCPTLMAMFRPGQLVAAAGLNRVLPRLSPEHVEAEAERPAGEDVREPV